MEAALTAENFIELLEEKGSEEERNRKEREGHQENIHTPDRKGSH